MDFLIVIIWICFAIPLTLSLVFLEKKSRRVMSFVLAGSVICLFAAFTNGTINSLCDLDSFYFTVNVSPITEELFKCIPVLIFAIFVSDNKSTLLSLSMAVGIGFAITENILIFIQNDASLDVIWAIQRVFGASLMHSITTMAVGYGLSFVQKRKKLFYTGTFALLVLAIVYHSVYNALVQSDIAAAGLLMPIVTYIPFVIVKLKDKNKKEKNNIIS